MACAPGMAGFLGLAFLEAENPAPPFSGPRFFPALFTMEMTERLAGFLAHLQDCACVGNPPGLEALAAELAQRMDLTSAKGKLLPQYAPFFFETILASLAILEKQLTFAISNEPYWNRLILLTCQYAADAFATAVSGQCGQHALPAACRDNGKLSYFSTNGPNAFDNDRGNPAFEGFNRFRTASKDILLQVEDFAWKYCMDGDEEAIKFLGCICGIYMYRIAAIHGIKTKSPLQPAHILLNQGIPLSLRTFANFIRKKGKN